MGQFRKGILGGFSGKVGNIIGSTWKGITYMRSLSEIRHRKASEKQVIQRSKFAYAVAFLQPLFPVIQLGYRTKDTRQSPMNAAMAEVLKVAIEGDYPAFRINYEKLNIAKGTLPVASRQNVVVNGDEIEFTWQDSNAITENYGDNQAILVALGDGLYPSYSFSEFVRSNAGGVLPLPDGQSGSIVHCYLAFAHSSDSLVSNSRYVGSVSIP